MNIKKHPIILASTSPRRQELFAQICNDFQIAEPSFEEKIPPKMSPLDVPAFFAMEKAKSIQERYPSRQ